MPKKIQYPESMKEEMIGFREWMHDRTDLSDGSVGMYVSYVKMLREPIHFDTMETETIVNMCEDIIRTTPVRAAFKKYMDYKSWEADSLDTKKEIMFVKNYLSNMNVRGSSTLSKSDILKMYLTNEQIQQFNDFVIEDYQHHDYYDELQVLPILLYETACRIGELLHLNPNRIDMEENKIRIVNAKRGKTRFVNFNQSEFLLKEFMDKYQDRSELFHIPYSTVYNVFVRVGRKQLGIGIEEGEKPVSPHWFRHSFATNWAIMKIQEGVVRAEVKEQVRDYLGHDDLKTTEEYIEAAAELERDNIFKEGGFDLKINTGE